MFFVFKNLLYSRFCRTKWRTNSRLIPSAGSEKIFIRSMFDFSDVVFVRMGPNRFPLIFEGAFVPIHKKVYRVLIPIYAIICSWG